MLPSAFVEKFSARFIPWSLLPWSYTSSSDRGNRITRVNSQGSGWEWVGNSPFWRTWVGLRLRRNIKSPCEGKGNKSQWKELNTYWHPPHSRIYKLNSKANPLSWSATEKSLPSPSIINEFRILKCLPCLIWFDQTPLLLAWLAGSFLLSTCCNWGRVERRHEWVKSVMWYLRDFLVTD